MVFSVSNRILSHDQPLIEQNLGTFPRIVISKRRNVDCWYLDYGITLCYYTGLPIQSIITAFFSVHSLFPFPIRIPWTPKSPILPCLLFVIVQEEYMKTMQLFRLTDSRRTSFSELCLVRVFGNSHLCRQRNRLEWLFPWRVISVPKSTCLKWCHLSKRSIVCVSFTWMYRFEHVWNHRKWSIMTRWMISII